jgi:hypothetical protein
VGNFASKLQKVHPEGMEAVLGEHRVFRFATTTPAHVFKSAAKSVRGGRLVEVTARDGFDERLAAFLLDQVELAKLPPLQSETIRVIPAAFPPPWRFDSVVLVPPRIANRFEHESKVLRRVTYWVLPAFEGEFADGADGEAFWRQIRRKDGRHSPVVDWARPPRRRKSFND